MISQSMLNIDLCSAVIGIISAIKLMFRGVVLSRWRTLCTVMVLVVFAIGQFSISGYAAGNNNKKAVKLNPKDDAQMVWVPAGTFLMGSTDKQIASIMDQHRKQIANDPVYKKDDFMKNLAKGVLARHEISLSVEKPQHKVNLGGYWIYKHEVTVAQYRKFCTTTKRKMPQAPKWGWRADDPVVNVSWQDAVDYAKWAGMSLPTEAQWEKAARGTDGRIYPWGNAWDASRCAVYKPGKGPSPVGKFPSGKSPYGCMDMAGYAREWCLDWFDPYYYQRSPADNPMGPPRGVNLDNVVIANDPWRGAGMPAIPQFPSHSRVIRGVDVRCTSRDGVIPTRRRQYVGFRCVGKP